MRQQLYFSQSLVHWHGVFSIDIKLSDDELRIYEYFFFLVTFSLLSRFSRLQFIISDGGFFSLIRAVELRCECFSSPVVED